MPGPRTIPMLVTSQADDLARDQVMKIARLLRQRRFELGFTQRQVARRAGVVVSTISDWETGRNLTIRSLYLWSLALDLKPELTFKIKGTKKIDKT